MPLQVFGLFCWMTWPQANGSWNELTLGKGFSLCRGWLVFQQSLQPHFFTHSPSPPMPIAVFALPSLAVPGAPCPLPPDTQTRGHGRGCPGPLLSATPRWTTAKTTHRCGHLRQCRRCCRCRRCDNDGGGLLRPHCVLIEINDVPEKRY